MRTTLITTKKGVLVVLAFYIYFATESVRDLHRVHQSQSYERMPITIGLGCIACIVDFVIMLCITQNNFERWAALASTLAFIPTLLVVAGVRFHFALPQILVSRYWYPAFTIAATIAVVCRTIELFTLNPRPSPLTL